MAIAALWTARKELHGDRRAAVRFAAAVTMVGVGSAFFHASLTFWGQTADVVGMYLVATFLLLESVAQRSRRSAGQHDARFWGGNGMLLAGLVIIPEVRRYLFAALVLAILWSEWRNRTRSPVAGSPARPMVTAVGVLAAGFTVWVLDITRVVCAPDSPWQGHALWHVLGAASTWLAYRAIVRTPTAA